MKEYQVILRDSDGYELHQRPAEGLKAAKETARYLASEAWASGCETTHEALGSSRVEVLNEAGECVWDMEVEAKAGV